MVSGEEMLVASKEYQHKQEESRPLIDKAADDAIGRLFGGYTPVEDTTTEISLEGKAQYTNDIEKEFGHCSIDKRTADDPKGYVRPLPFNELELEEQACILKEAKLYADQAIGAIESYLGSGTKDPVMDKYGTDIESLPGLPPKVTPGYLVEDLVELVSGLSDRKYIESKVEDLMEYNEKKGYVLSPQQESRIQKMLE